MPYQQPHIHSISSQIYDGINRIVTKHVGTGSRQMSLLFCQIFWIFTTVTDKKKIKLNNFIGILFGWIFRGFVDCINLAQALK